jgi:hypothetical protein
MLTDLFVAAGSRGRGIGGQLLEALFDGKPQRMTFSSKHPAAMPAYRRTGMHPRWRLLYTSGPAAGGGGALSPGAWRHDRLALVGQMERDGATVYPDALLATESDGLWLARLCGDAPVEVFISVISSLPAGTIVRFCAPEHSPVVVAALDRGFTVTDHDIFMSSPGVGIDPLLHCLDPGLV